MTDRERTNETQSLSATPRVDPADTLAQDAALAAIPDESPRAFGRYRLERLLGRGAMGAVYQAYDPSLDRRVAVKIPLAAGDPGTKTRSRFEAEAKAASALRHPGICPVYDVGEADGKPYLTMAFIDGKPLDEVLPADGWPDPMEAGEIVRKVALALDSAHRAGVVHRDLKPSNVMLDASGEPIVTDFGLARRKVPGQARLTLDGTVLGTPAYMAPEQARGEPAGPAADIYSLGAILYELLTGRAPFDGGSIAVVMSKVLTEEPPPVESRRSGVPARLAAIVRTAMAKKPEERFASMAAFAEALAGGGDVCLANRRRHRLSNLLMAAPLILLAVTALATATHTWLSHKQPADLPAAVPTDPAELTAAARTALDKSCASCHGKPNDDDGDFAYLFDVPKLIEEKLLKPGNPDGSKLVVRIVNDEMPPKKVRHPRPTPTDVAVIRAWVAAGAPPFAP